MAIDNNTPRELGFRQPADWERHARCFTAWPAVDEYWEGHVREAQEEFVAFCAVIADVKNEQLDVLVADDHNDALARKALQHVAVHFRRIAYGDSWLRDTGPVFVTHQDEGVAAVRFGFNGWGKKYIYPHDDTVAAEIARALGLKEFVFPWVMEGGAIDSDGEGTCLVSRDCLLDKNRNPDQNEDQMTEKLRQALGFDSVMWLAGSLINDHTDGHVDTIARFVAPHVAVCMEPLDSDDPNAHVLEQVANQLARFRDAKGRKLVVKRVAAPGRVVSRTGQLLPASYLNFYITNTSVIVPVYGSRHDERAVDQIAALFPGRRAIGSSAKEILEGGGAFHCITDSLPTVRSTSP
jgi:agmatine deiminase